jgi:hypothetical protein
VNLRYDKEKYKEMLLDAAQSVLGYFGFDRTVYGDNRNTIPRKWRWLQGAKTKGKMISRRRCLGIIPLL